MRKTFLLFLAVIFSTIVIADNLTLQDSYDWLMNQSDDGSYNDDIIDTVSVVMVLDLLDSIMSEEIIYINSEEDSDNCWPDGSCKVKDTAFAVYALYLNGDNTTDGKEWLSDAKTVFSDSGDWYLQVATSDSGVCNIKYEKNDKTTEKTIDITDGRFPSCSNSSWLDLDSCLDSDLSSILYTMFDIDCTELSGAILSLIYKEGNSIYLVDTLDSNMGELVYNNGCYGTTKGSACDIETTIYTDWILDMITGDIDVPLYSKINYEEDNPIHNSLLYLTTPDELYLNNLKSIQRSSGSFDNNAKSTAFGFLALKKAGESYSDTEDWLYRQQKDDGSFGDVFTTSIVIYSLGGEGIDVPSDGGDGDGEEEEEVDVCDDDGVCDPNQGEDCYNCPDDCGSCDTDEDDDEEDKEEKICDNNGVCDINLIKEFNYTENEDYVNCPHDCFCGDKVCDDMEKSDDSCSTDCGDEDETEYPPVVDVDGEDEGGSFWAWFFIIIILLALVGGGYFFYVKFYKSGKKGRKNEFKFLKGDEIVKKEYVKDVKEKPRSASRFNIPSFIKKEEKSPLDRAIDKSIMEAKKLMGGRK